MEHHFYPILTSLRKCRLAMPALLIYTTKRDINIDNITCFCHSKHHSSNTSLTCYKDAWPAPQWTVCPRVSAVASVWRLPSRPAFAPSASRCLCPSPPTASLPRKGCVGGGGEGGGFRSMLFTWHLHIHTYIMFSICTN